MNQLGIKKKQVCSTDICCLVCSDYILYRIDVCSFKYFLYSLQSRYFSLLSEGSGFDEDSNFRLDEIDRQTLMVTLADLEYILVRATHGESAQVIG